MLILKYGFQYCSCNILVKMAQIIKVRIFLNVELSGLHENIQNFYPRCSGSREITKNKVAKVLADTL